MTNEIAEHMRSQSDRYLARVIHDYDARAESAFRERDPLAAIWRCVANEARAAYLPTLPMLHALDVQAFERLRTLTARACANDEGDGLWHALAVEIAKIRDERAADALTISNIEASAAGVRIIGPVEITADDGNNRHVSFVMRVRPVMHSPVIGLLPSLQRL